MKRLVLAFAILGGTAAAPSVWACDCQKQQEKKACDCPGQSCPGNCAGHDDAQKPQAKPDKSSKK
jgi:hypothetical protein